MFHKCHLLIPVSPLLAVAGLLKGGNLFRGRLDSKARGSAPKQMEII